MVPIQDDIWEPNGSNYAFPIWVLYGPHIVFIWGSPYGTHMEPCCIPYMGPIWVAHMGPI